MDEGTKGPQKEKFATRILQVLRKWWRPLSCVFIALSLLLHGLIIPVYNMLNNGPQTDLSGLSLLVSAVAGAFAVREWGKFKGLSND